MWRSVLVGAFIVVSLTACNQEQSKNNQSSASASPKQVFSNNCSSCHGEQLQGGMGPDISKVGERYSAKEIAAIIEHGQGQMPPQNQLEAKDREKLAQWLAQKK